MRWHILRTLLVKEILRHAAEKGAIFLTALLVAAALLISFFGKDNGQMGHFVAGVQTYIVDAWEDDGWFVHLRQHRPDDNLMRVRFRTAANAPTDSEGRILYTQSSAAVQIRPNGKDDQGRPRYHIVFWHPGKDKSVLTPFAEWFWKETLRYYQDTNIEIETAEDSTIFPAAMSLIEVRPVPGEEGKPRHKLVFLPLAQGSPRIIAFGEEKQGELRSFAQPLEIREERLALPGAADERSMMATGLVIFGLCFFGVYLLPSLTCEERERGVLLAQALSPASPREILAAKFMFYPVVGIALAAVLGGIYRPGVLLLPIFWMALVTLSFGFLGIGLSIASLARTQRVASMGALCYMLTVALLLFITQRLNIPSIQYVALEYYGPRLIHDLLANTESAWNYRKLFATAVIAFFWFQLATYLFRRQGWQ